MTALELPDAAADQALLVENDQRGFGSVFLQRAQNTKIWKPIQFLSGVFRNGDQHKSGAERAALGCSQSLKKMVAWINPQAKLQIFTNEPAD